jgi:hypothetical protein
MQINKENNPANAAAGSFAWLQSLISNGESSSLSTTDENKAEPTETTALIAVDHDDEISKLSPLRQQEQESSPSPELFLTQKLNELETELAKIRTKPAYEQAQRQQHQFVKDIHFRLQFLHADSFDASKAAERLVRYMECKRQLFGNDVLTKPAIALKDLDEVAIKSGGIQILPRRDTSGRPVVFCCLERLFHNKQQLVGRSRSTTEEAVLQLFFYLAMSLCEDEENQKRGIVVVIYAVDSICSPSFEVLYSSDFQHRQSSLFFLRGLTLLAQSLPIQMGSFHYCCNGAPQTRVISNVMLYHLAGTQIWDLSRIHYGTCVAIIVLVRKVAVRVRIPLQIECCMHLMECPFFSCHTLHRLAYRMPVCSLDLWIALPMPARFERGGAENQQSFEMGRTTSKQGSCTTWIA